MPIITNKQTKQQVSLGEHTVPISSEYSNTAFPQLFHYFKQSSINRRVWEQAIQDYFETNRLGSRLTGTTFVTPIGIGLSNRALSNKSVQVVWPQSPSYLLKWSCTLSFSPSHDYSARLNWFHQLLEDIHFFVK